MAVNLEKRIQILSDELKALKAIYSVYGGAMKIYGSTSSNYSWHWTETYLPVVRFTSSWETNKNILVASITTEMWDSNGDLIYSPPEITLDIQNKTGSVDIHLLPNINMTKFRITLYSTSPGTFTRIQ